MAEQKGHPLPCPRIHRLENYIFYIVQEYIMREPWTKSYNFSNFYSLNSDIIGKKRFCQLASFAIAVHILVMGMAVVLPGTISPRKHTIIWKHRYPSAVNIVATAGLTPQKGWQRSSPISAEQASRHKFSLTNNIVCTKRVKWLHPIMFWHQVDSHQPAKKMFSVMLRQLSACFVRKQNRLGAGRYVHRSHLYLGGVVYSAHHISHSNLRYTVDKCLISVSRWSKLNMALMGGNIKECPNIITCSVMFDQIKYYVICKQRLSTGAWPAAYGMIPAWLSTTMY